MKIVISSYTFLPDIGGVATNVSVLAKGFVDAGHEVVVLTLTTEEADQDFPFTVIRRPDAKTLIRYYREADILILSNLSLSLFYPLLWMKRPFALRHHSERAWKELHGGLLSTDSLRRRIIKRATHFMTSDYCGRESGLEYAVTHPFANPRFITPDVTKPTQERQDIVFVGRLEEEKGILWLLDRMELVREHLGEHRLRIVGDGKLRATVEAAAKDHPFIDYIGRLNLADTAKAMGAAAYSIIPSLWAEPFGAVSTESLAAGALTIHSDRGGLPETTAALGYHFDPDNEASFVTALQQARQQHETMLASNEAEIAYRSAVAAHIANFQPDRVVDTIISTMGTLHNSSS